MWQNVDYYTIKSACCFDAFSRYKGGQASGDYWRSALWKGLAPMCSGKPGSMQCAATRSTPTETVLRSTVPLGVALRETRRLMGEIDALIPGWPLA